MRIKLLKLVLHVTQYENDWDSGLLKPLMNVRSYMVLGLGFNWHAVRKVLNRAENGTTFLSPARQSSGPTRPVQIPAALSQYQYSYQAHCLILELDSCTLPIQT
jgi:hypothetical protein